MEVRRVLSKILDVVMDTAGASESMRQLHRSAATTQEILAMMSSNEPVITYHCGSSYEGTVTPDTASDTDIIGVVPTPSTVTHLRMTEPGLQLLMFRDDCTFPGYVKLQGFHGDQPLTVENCRAAKQWAFDRNGRACWMHFPGANMHGPATMLKGDDGKHLVDLVAALKCDSIPQFALEWISRQRSHGWPTEQLLDQMSTMGCMVVGVGFYKSPEKDIEWRLSFSLQERMLMTSLNMYQHRIYILLKLIKKNILEKELQEEALSSYHCKTCVFYIAEMTPPQMWTQENLIDCLLACLRLLLEWLTNSFCPSYFIKEQNLFEKEGFERLIKPLQKAVNKILQSGPEFLTMLQSDSIGEILMTGDMNLFRVVSDLKVNKYIFQIRFKVLHSITGAYLSILRTTNLHQDVLQFLIAHLDTIQTTDRVSDHSPEVTKAALSHVMPWLHLHIGMKFACRAVTSSTNTDQQELMKEVESHFRLARNTDFANVRLAHASILFRLGKLEECLTMLDELEASWSSKVINYCLCKQEGTRVPDVQGLHDNYPPMRDMSVTELLRNYIATCVVFLPSQCELVPTPLMDEMFRSMGTSPGSKHEKKDAWFDWAVVDAKVYLHFMKYLVCSKLGRQPHKQIAMENMASLIQDADDHDLGHKETAYNLLGWIYLQETRPENAMGCFCHSWQIRQHHNAVKFRFVDEYMHQTLADEQTQNQVDYPTSSGSDVLSVRTVVQYIRDSEVSHESASCRSECS